jgi:hypothetical protein
MEQLHSGECKEGDVMDKRKQRTVAQVSVREIIANADKQLLFETLLGYEVMRTPCSKVMLLYALGSLPAISKEVIQKFADEMFPGKYEVV